MLPSYEELTAARYVTVDGIYNMRDLGGLPRHDGGTVPRGRFYRADNLASLPPDGVATVLRLGIRTVIDLRQGRSGTQAAQPPAATPAGGVPPGGHDRRPALARE